MAFGIDDVLMAAAAGVSLADTCAEVVKRHRKKGDHIDIELLIEEVRLTALQRIDEADLALAQLERTLVDRGVDISKALQQCIDATSRWRPFESHRLKRIKASFDALADATYSATDDIASLLRCIEHQLLLVIGRGVNLVSIQYQEDFHRSVANPLVPIDEGVICQEAEAQRSGLVDERRV